MSSREVASVESSRTSAGGVASSVCPGKQMRTAALPAWSGGPAVASASSPSGAAVQLAPGAALPDPFDFRELSRPSAPSSAAAEAPLQLESLGVEGQGAPRGEAAQQIAQRGVAGACSRLPYAEVIAGAFGHHDISDVRATVGGPAAEASQALGARAYATGTTIAFAEAPDLRLAAHEAAHVVQQRAGVHLDDGMGRAGDVYELHADAVADAVVRGQSAEGLLDQHAGGGRGASPGSSAATQRAAIQRFDPSQTPAQAAEEARGILRALAAMPPAQQDERIAGWSADWTRQFLAAVSDADRTTYAAVLERVGTGRATVDGERFSTAFRADVPPDVLAAFGGEAGTTAARLTPQFSATQRDKLLAFFSNHQIPERLFNDGDGAGLLEARRRVMLSAHILTTGTYANQDAEQQRVEARNCGHFVSLVNAYAGVGSAAAEDVRGNFDHRGDVVLHGGGVGAETHSPSDGALPMDRFDSDVHAGDWLYIHNRINHSVIFSAWIDQRPRSVEHNGETYRYRRAITYDQLHNSIGEGGLRHAESTVMLGDRGLSRARDGARVTIQTITRVAPPQEETVATTPDDLIPAGANLEAAAERNRVGLEQAGIPIAEAIAHVRGQNDALFAIVNADRAGGDHSSRLSESQRDLLRQANTATELEPLVHLNERLQRLADGVRFLETAEARDTARSYGAESRAPEDRRAAGGYHTSSGRTGAVDGRAYDTVGETPTTGYLERVREPLRGYPPRGPAAAPRGRGRGRAASAEPAAPAEPVNAPAACGE